MPLCKAQTAQLHYHSPEPHTACLSEIQSFSSKPFWLGSKTTYLLALCFLSSHLVCRKPTPYTCHRWEFYYPPSSAFFSLGPLGDKSTHSLLQFIFFCCEIKSSLLHHPNSRADGNGFPIAAAPSLNVEVRENTYSQSSTYRVRKNQKLSKLQFPTSLRFLDFNSPIMYRV